MSFKHLALAVFAGTTLLAPVSRGPQPQADPIGSTNGTVLISTHYVDGGREMNVVLLVDESQEATTTDGQVDRVFMLQAPGGSERTIDLRIPMAQVDWDSEAVRVRSSSGHRLEFTVGTGGESSSEAEHRVHGFGLVHTVGWDLLLPEAGLSDEGYFDLFEGLHTRGACADTEPPHTHCELEAKDCNGKSCEVTCAAGTEACCQCSGGSPSCKCQVPS